MPSSFDIPPQLVKAMTTSFQLPSDLFGRKAILNGQMAHHMIITTGMATSQMMVSSLNQKMKTVSRSGTDTAVVGGVCILH